MDKEKDDIYNQIIRDSAVRLRDIKMLANFFNHHNLFAVYIRTKVIHNLFESNKALDIHKLELFHVQYTSSLTDLFRKLKKAKEQQYLLVSDEIYINNDLVAKLEKEISGSNFKREIKTYNHNMSVKLQEAYSLLEAGTSPAGFSWGSVTGFSARLGQEYYRDIPSAEMFSEITNTQGKQLYTAPCINIERKLLGRLNKYNFRIKFTCGLKHQNEFIEIFDFIDSNERFVFINASKTFLLFDEKEYPGLDISKNQPGKQNIISSLTQKNAMLTEKLATIKTSLTSDVEEVLAGYLEKISGVDFLDELQNVDEQTNILRAMLNININTK